MAVRFHRSKAGFSLIEMVVLIVVIALAVPPTIILLCEVLWSNSEIQARTKATALAKGLMEEILSKSFEDPGGASGSFGTEEASRADYDDVDDYDGLNVCPAQDSQGNVLSGYAGFRTAVTVENVGAGAPGGASVADGSTDFKRVTVAVTANDGSSTVRLVGLASSFGIDDTLSGLTFIERADCEEGKGGGKGKGYTKGKGGKGGGEKDVTFFFRNDTGQAFYATHLIATWASPTAYYEQIKFQVDGGTDYKEVWKSKDHNNVRVGSGEAAMFNQGKRVLIPADATVEVEMKEFKTSKTGGSDADMEHTVFEVEIYAAPTKYRPFIVPAEP